MPRRKPEPIDDVTAKYGEKMITLTLRFYTSKLGAEGKVRRKHMWDDGVVELDKNTLHGIAHDRHQFDGLVGIAPTILTLLKRNNIRVHHGRHKPFVP